MIVEAHALFEREQQLAAAGRLLAGQRPWVSTRPSDDPGTSLGCMPTYLVESIVADQPEIQGEVR